MNIAALAFAILTICSLPNGFPIATFRSHHLGPEGRSVQLASYFADAASTYGVDAFALTALGSAESNFDGSRVGSAGERGIMQTHPLYDLGRAYARFVGTQDQRDRFSIFLGAEALRRGLDRCHTLQSAVVYYRTGHCGWGPRALRVMAVRRRLLHAAGAL